VTKAPIEIPLAKVLRIRNQLNRAAIFASCALCFLLFGRSVFELFVGSVTILQIVLASGPLIVAYLLVRQLPKYSDQKNG
jgi:hypothetical protein